MLYECIPVSLAMTDDRYIMTQHLLSYVSDSASSAVLLLSAHKIVLAWKLYAKTESKGTKVQCKYPRQC
jgi:hypothetical protein